MADEEPVTSDWDDRVQAFWASADDTDPERLLRDMRALVDERSSQDVRALYEWASVHDFLGDEASAVPIYRAAIEAGPDDNHRAQAIVKLVNSLRNIGDPHAAVQLLQSEPQSITTGSVTQAFLALVLHDAGHPERALQDALLALAPTVRFTRAQSRRTSEHPQSTSHTRHLTTEHQPNRKRLNRQRV